MMFIMMMVVVMIIGDDLFLYTFESYNSRIDENIWLTSLGILAKMT